MPGQRFERDGSMDCHDEFAMMHPDILTCTVIDVSGNIRYVYLASKNTVIEYLGFSVTGLRLGDVQALYGAPDSWRTFNGGFTVRWDDQLSVWGRQSSRLMLTRRVNYIAFS